jgi:hypothetical protein
MIKSEKTTTVAQEAPTCPTLGGLARLISADPAIGLLGRGAVRADGIALSPSGLDALACCIARSLLAGTPSAALALPRGTTGLPAMLGMYLVMQRWAYRHLHGSVLVATAQRSLSTQLRNLTVEGVAFERLRVGRLVSRQRPGTDRSRRGRRAMMRPLDRTAPVGLSQNDGFLLFAALGSIPAPPAPGVITYTVVDCFASSRPAPGRASDPDSPDAWSSAYRSTREADARSVWLGELGDPDFEAFCKARGIPLIRIGWDLAAEAAALSPFGQGRGVLGTRGLCRRVLDPRPIGLRVVADPERDEHSREAYMLLGKMRKRGRGGALPAPVRAAYRLLAICSRLGCTAETYEGAASIGSPVFNTSVARLRQEVVLAESSQFRDRWKEAYRRYWDSAVGELRALWRLAQEEPRKLLALFEEIAEAQTLGRQLVVVCQTQTERRALLETLKGLDATEGVLVTTFARPAAAGGAEEPRRTLLMGPPPPWQTPALLSAEAGDTVALCYPFEEVKLAEALEDAQRVYCDDRNNAAALARLFPAAEPAPSDGWAPTEILGMRREAVFEIATEDDGPTSASPPGGEGEELWRELIDLWGSEIDAPGRARTGDEVDLDSGYGGLAHVLHFESSPPVALRADRTIDILSGEEIVSKLPGELEPGDHVAFLPGHEQHSLREILTSSWDETLATERALCEPLWRGAITTAVSRIGIADLAGRCGRHESTIRTWVDGRAAPQRPEDFEAVLTAAGQNAASDARAAIWHYLQRTRTMHRLIGKKLRAAVAESISEAPDQRAVRDLEEMTGVAVGDLLDVVEELVVEQVDAARPVRLADCGRFLDLDHPLPSQGEET